MKNICILTNTLLSGGAEKQAALLSTVLNDKFNVWLIVYHGELIENKFTKMLSKKKVNVIMLKGNNAKKLYTLFWFFRKNTIDIIFSYLLKTNLIGSLIGMLSGVKFIFGGIRDSFFPRRKVYFYRFIHNNLCYANIYNNYRGVENLSKIGFNKKKSIVIPNCISIKTNPIIRKNNNKIKILSVGRFTVKKDYLSSIKTIALLKNKYKNIEYTIIGWGELENKVRNWITDNNINDITEIVINPKNLNDYYIDSDIYLQTSIYEGCPNTVLEAMSFSLPTVLTDAGDNNILINDSEYLSQPGDIKGLYSGLNKLISSYELRIQNGSQNYKLVKQNYSINSFKNRYSKLIEKL